MLFLILPNGSLFYEESHVIKMNPKTKQNLRLFDSVFLLSERHRIQLKCYCNPNPTPQYLNLTPHHYNVCLHV